MCRITVRGGILTASAISLAVLPRATSDRISLSRAVNGETSTSPAYQQRGRFTTVSLPELERPGLPIQETGPAESLCDNRLRARIIGRSAQDTIVISVMARYSERDARANGSGGLFSRRLPEQARDIPSRQTVVR